MISELIKRIKANSRPVVIGYKAKFLVPDLFPDTIQRVLEDNIKNLELNLHVPTNAMDVAYSKVECRLSSWNMLSPSIFDNADVESTEIYLSSDKVTVNEMFRSSVADIVQVSPDTETVESYLKILAQIKLKTIGS